MTVGDGVSASQGQGASSDTAATETTETTGKSPL